MTNLVKKLLWIVLVLAVLGDVARAQRPSAVVCLTEEVQSLGGSPPQSLYNGDRYEDGPSTCLDGPTFVQFMTDAGKTVPQICPGCDTARKLADAQQAQDARKTSNCPKLFQPFAVDHDFLANVPEQSKTPKGTIWYPRKCKTLLLTRWVRLQTPGRTIPVKLYVVESDLTKPEGGLAERERPKHPVRTLLLGFEMAGYPPTVDQDALPVLQPTPWEQNPECLTSCRVKPDAESAEFFVLTHRPVFVPPKAKVVGK